MKSTDFPAFHQAFTALLEEYDVSIAVALFGINDDDAIVVPSVVHLQDRDELPTTKISAEIAKSLTEVAVDMLRKYNGLSRVQAAGALRAALEDGTPTPRQPIRPASA